MKLSKWAKKQGVSYLTAYKWFKAGKIDGAKQLDTGTILVDDANLPSLDNKGRVYLLVVNPNNVSDDVIKDKIKKIQEILNKE